ncbi:hypothetical protein [Amycolatopsis orientalis]|uniref:hypothetical protein n=1 Tax=Amycolatopsis orientalis TaxID=31958 RepID=UPI0003A97F8B|nr:hypothetical protein [Amycolatopsis orientalis]
MAKFKTGDRVRYIGDAEHGLWPSFRAMRTPGTIAEVLGTRMRVHFDGFGARSFTTSEFEVKAIEGEKITHKFETTYRGVKVPESLTNNLGTAEASWFKRGVDAAIDAAPAKVTVAGYEPEKFATFQLPPAGIFPASYWRDLLKPKFRYFRSQKPSRANGEHHYWRTAGDATELYSLSSKRWEAATVTLDALRSAAQISEVLSGDVPEHVRNAPKAEGRTAATRYFRTSPGFGGQTLWYRFSGGKLEVWDNVSGWDPSMCASPERLKAFWPERTVHEVRTLDVPFRILNAK